MRVLLAGMIAGVPGQGGATWAVLQYALGLERLGHDVFLAEPVAEVRPTTAAYFAQVVDEFGLTGRAALVPAGEPCPFARDADVLLNVSGMLRGDELAAIPTRVYLDLDPVFNQLWHAAEGLDVGFADHTHHVTVGQALGRPGCAVPTCGIGWIPTLPPVVLEHWPVAERVELEALTTVANWRGYGSIQHEGVHYGQKAHSLRRFIDLPARTGERIVLALAIDSGETRDLDALAAHGWELLDAREAAGTPAAYRSFVQASRAEIGIAKSGYVDARSAWFSDRSACYLASGRPVIAQDTGFPDFLPTGAGLLAFRTADDAAAAAEELRRDYGRHARAARAIAEEFLDSDRVLTRLLRDVGALRPGPGPRLHEAAADDLAALFPSGATIVERRPSPYRSSAPIAEVVVALPDGSRTTALVKELGRTALTGVAARAKPAFLADPLREIEVYRTVLAGAGLGTPALLGTLVDAARDRFWLAIEKIDGVELYQVGALETWQEALRWLARLHSRMAGAQLPARLIRYDRDFLRGWLARARAISELEATDGHELAVERLASLPRTLLHGDLYASNVLVSGSRVCAVDWELASVGPGVIDVAALTMGWGEAEQALLVEAYRRALCDPPPVAELARDLDCARLHLAVQWLGWSPDWSPPPQHAQNFREQARRAAERLAR